MFSFTLGTFRCPLGRCLWSTGLPLGIRLLARLTLRLPGFGWLILLGNADETFTGFRRQPAPIALHLAAHLAGGRHQQLASVNQWPEDPRSCRSHAHRSPPSTRGRRRSRVTSDTTPSRLTTRRH